MIELIQHDWPASRMGAAAAAGAATGAASVASAGVAAGVALAADGINQWIASARLRGGQKIAATEIVNRMAEALGNMRDAYLAASPSCANQALALQVFDASWDFLQSPNGCGTPELGSAGERCISERAPGGIYSWKSGFRDAIANDPRVYGCGSQTVTVGPIGPIQFADSPDGVPSVLSPLISSGGLSGGSLPWGLIAIGAAAIFLFTRGSHHA